MHPLFVAIAAIAGQGTPVAQAPPGHVYHRPGATPAARDADLRRCRAITTGPMPETGRALTPPTDPATAPDLPRPPAPVTDTIGDCMTARGWNLYAVAPRTGALGQAPGAGAGAFDQAMDRKRAAGMGTIGHAGPARRSPAADTRQRGAAGPTLIRPTCRCVLWRGKAGRDTDGTPFFEMAMRVTYRVIRSGRTWGHYIRCGMFRFPISNQHANAKYFT